MSVYYNPKDHGLELFDEIEEPNLSYQFNMMIVCRHVASGRLFYSVDAGCSCPTPFEGDHFNSPDDTSMTEIKQGDSFFSFQREVDEFPAPESDRSAIIAKVKAAL